MQTSRYIPLCFVLSLLAAPDARAQAAAGRPPSRDAQELASAWAALAAGRPVEAERAANAILQRSPRSHDAVTLLVRARIGAGQPAGSLDVYEQWVRGVPREDVFLLQPIAAAILRGIAASNEEPARTRALELLAANGDADAPASLAQAVSAPGGGTLEVDAALAKTGDAAAIKRLEGRLQIAGRDVSTAIDALRNAKAKGSAAAIAATLDPARPVPTRMAAARALGALGAESNMPQLRNAMRDPDPPVRMAATLALAQLGDEAALARIDEFLNSPAADIRVAAAEVRAAQSPDGPWVGVVTAALQADDPLVRLHAARVLVEHGPDPSAGMNLLMQSLADPNPAMRLAAAGTLDLVSAAALPADLAGLRQLLRDGSADVRASAAGAILRMAGGVE